MKNYVNSAYPRLKLSDAQKFHEEYWIKWRILNRLLMIGNWSFVFGLDAQGVETADYKVQESTLKRNASSSVL